MAMLRAFRNLFSKTTSPVRRQRVSKPSQQSRLGVEQLSDRTMLSATAVLSGNVLNISGDSANDNVVVRRSSNTITVRDNTLGRDIGSFGANGITRIELSGNGGNDRLVNETSIESRFFGGAGNDVMIGGSGHDFFGDDEGVNTFTGGAGQDTLYRDGSRGFFTDGSAAEKDLAKGLLPKDARFTPAELKATGVVTVSKEGDRLILAGPSGAGFALRSSWTGSATSGRFSTNGPVVMETTYGDVTIIPASSVTTTLEVTDPRFGVGVYKTINWGVLPGGGTIQGNPLNGILAQAGNAAGLDVDTPGVTWGVGLGSQVRNLDGKAPVNNAVPYLFARMATGTTVSYNDKVSVSTPNNFSGTLAFAPGDGTVYASVSGLPLVSDLGIAVSPNGYIPYRPTLTPDGVSDPNILGHFYTRGALSLTDLRIPVGVRGEVVLDLDANDDGRLVGMTRANIGQSLSTFVNGLKTNPETTLLNTANAVVNDIAVGFNGGVDLEVKTITLTLADATAWYKPGQVAFRASTANPFQNESMLKDFWSGPKIDVQGRFDFTNGKRDWNFKANASTGNVFGMPSAGGFLEAGNSILSGGGIRAGVTMSAPGVGNVSFGGNIQFNGNFQLNGVGILAGSLGSVISGATVVSFEVARTNGLFSAKGNIVAAVSADIGIASFGAIGTLNFTFSANAQGRIVYSGSGTIYGGLTLFGISTGIQGASFSFDNGGITFNLPQPIGTRRINF